MGYRLPLSGRVVSGHFSQRQGLKCPNSGAKHRFSTDLPLGPQYLFTQLSRSAVSGVFRHRFAATHLFRCDLPSRLNRLLGRTLALFQN